MENFIFCAVTCVYKEYEVKKKWCKTNVYSLKWSFYCVMARKLSFSGENEPLMDEIKIW